MPQSDALARRRAAHRPEWNGALPHQLFDRLSEAPEAGDALCGVGDALLGSLDGRTLELVALRVAAVRACRYVWAGHCVIASRRASGRLTHDEIARIAAGPEAMDGPDAELLVAVDALLTRSAESALPLSVTIAVLFYDVVCMIMSDAEPDAAPVPGLEDPLIAAGSIR